MIWLGGEGVVGDVVCLDVDDLEIFGLKIR